MNKIKDTTTKAVSFISVFQPFHRRRNPLLYLEGKITSNLNTPLYALLARLNIALLYYQQVTEYAKYGTFIYEELPQHDIIRGHVICKIKKHNLIERPGSLDAHFHLEKWPKYWKEAEVLHRNGLL